MIVLPAVGHAIESVSGEGGATTLCPAPLNKTNNKTPTVIRKQLFMARSFLKQE
jgi:hypothetical protein